MEAFIRFFQGILSTVGLPPVLFFKRSSRRQRERGGDRGEEQTECESSDIAVETASSLQPPAVEDDMNVSMKVAITTKLLTSSRLLTTLEGGNMLRGEGKMKLMDLPHYFLVSLLVDWLGIKGTMSLDRAMSDREQRERLLDMILSGDVCFQGAVLDREHSDVCGFLGEVKDSCRMHDECLAWLCKRKVSVRNVFAGYWDTKERTREMVLTVAKNSPQLEGLHVAIFETIGDQLAQVGEVHIHTYIHTYMHTHTHTHHTHAHKHHMTRQ